MPWFIISLIVQISLVVHVVRTGRNMMWIWLIIFVPLVGSIAYFIVEIFPDLSRGRAVRRATTGLQRTFNPERDLREAQKRLKGTDSIETRRRLGEELIDHQRYDEAIEHFRAGLTGIYTHEPLLLLGMARAQFANGEPAEARRTLERLIRENPDFKSAEGHLLYARAVEGAGDLAKAAEEYAELAKYYAGAEARYRYGLLLRRMGQPAQARAVLQQLLDDADLAASHYRKAQKEWLELAQRELAKN